MNDFLLRYKKILIFVVIGVAVCLLIGIVFILRLKKSTSQSKSTTKYIQPTAISSNLSNLLKQPKETIIATIKKDSIYAFQVQDIKKQINQLDENVILASLKSDSLLLQEAEKENLLKLPADFFTKEYKQSSSYIEDKDHFLLRLEAEYESRSAQIEGGIITVFFYNQKFSSLPFDQADQKAYELVSEAREKILSKEWTISQAIDELTKKKDMPLLDFNYLYNTGFVIPKTAVYRVFRDKEIINEIKSFKDGVGFQVGSIQRSPGDKTTYGKQYFIQHPDANGYYYFFVITNKNDGYYESFNDWKIKIMNQTP
jgi:hypothetical protein